MNDATSRKSPQEWVEALDRADADVAAGRVYSGEAVRQRLRDSIQQLRTDAEKEAPLDR